MANFLLCSVISLCELHLCILRLSSCGAGCAGVRKAAKRRGKASLYRYGEQKWGTDQEARGGWEKDKSASRGNAEVCKKTFWRICDSINLASNATFVSQIGSCFFSIPCFSFLLLLFLIIFIFLGGWGCCCWNQKAVLFCERVNALVFQLLDSLSVPL